MVGEIPYNVYSELYDVGVDCIQKAYELGKSELEKENVKLKEKLKPENCLKSLAKSGFIKFTCENGNEHDQLTKAKEIIKTYYEDNLDEAEFYSLRKKAEQFLKGEFTAEQTNECHDCAKFDEMPKGPRCKTCDNGSHFQRR